MHGRLLDQIKIQHNSKLKQKGGSGFLKLEIKASDVRLNCREGQKLINKTKKYLSGDFKKILLNNDKQTDYILNEH